MMIKIMLLIALFKPIDYNLNSVIKTLKKVESLNNTSAIGDCGKAFGILQIHKVYVDEVNEKFNTDYTHEEMFFENCANEVFFLYMTLANNYFQKKFNRNATEEEIVRSHNGGFYSGYKNPKTIKYYKKYLLFKNKEK